MDFGDYLQVLRRNWKLLLGSGLVAVFVAGLVSLFADPVYTSRTQLFVSTQGSGSVAELNQGSVFTLERVQTYVQTVTTPAVLDPVIEELDLDATSSELAERVTAEAETNTVLISIAVEDESPMQAAKIADAVGDSLVEVVDELETITDGQSPVKLSTVTPAGVPSSPSSPNVPLNLVIGLVVGLAAGAGIALLRATLDTRLRSEADLRRVTDIPLLGGIAFDEGAVKKPLLTQAAAQSPRAESFRQLRTNLQFSQVDDQGKSLLVTSSLPGEGKTTTSVNMAIAMAQAGQRVLLIDGDLRRPRVAKYMGLEGSVGLTTALVGQGKFDDVLQPWGDDELYVLTSGKVPPNPSELLGSGQMRQLMEQASAEFDVVVIDGPPLLPVTDSAIVSRSVGGVVVVVGAHSAKTQDLEKSLKSLELVEANVLGVVMNRLPVKGPDAYRYSYYNSDVPVEVAPPIGQDSTSHAFVQTGDRSMDLSRTFAGKNELMHKQPVFHANSSGKLSADPPVSTRGRHAR